MLISENYFVYGAVLLLYTLLEFSGLALSSFIESPQSKIALVGERTEFRCTLTVGYIYWFINGSPTHELSRVLRTNINATYSRRGHGETSTLTILANENTNKTQIVCAHDYGYSDAALLLVQGNLTSPVNLTAVFNDTQMTVYLEWKPPFILCIESDSDVCHQDNKLVSHFVVHVKIVNDTLLGPQCNNTGQNVMSPWCQNPTVKIGKTNLTEHQFNLVQHNVSMCDLKHFEFMVSVVSRIGAKSDLSKPVGVEHDGEDEMCKDNHSRDDSDELNMNISSTTTTTVTVSETNDGILVATLGAIGAFIVALLTFLTIPLVVKCCKHSIKKRKTASVHVTKIKMTDNDCYGSNVKKYKESYVPATDQTRASPMYEDPDALIDNRDCHANTLPVYSEIDTLHEKTSRKTKEELENITQTDNKYYLDNEMIVVPTRASESSSSPHRSVCRGFRIGYSKHEELVNNTGPAAKHTDTGKIDTQRRCECDSSDDNVKVHVSALGNVQVQNAVTIPDEFYEVVRGIEEHGGYKSHVIERDYELTCTPVEETQA